MTTTGHTDDRRVEEILDRLRGNGGRLTTGRRAIVEALLQAGDHHLNADELAAAVQTRYPHVHLSTVYRTLDALEAAGVLDRMALGTGGAVYHFTDHVHHHLVCKDCGSVVDIPPDLVSSLTGELQRRFGYDLDQARLAVSGRCSECRPAGQPLTSR